jgi:hypothetical protein
MTIDQMFDDGSSLAERIRQGIAMWLFQDQLGKEAAILTGVDPSVKIVLQFLAPGTQE